MFKTSNFFGIVVWERRCYHISLYTQEHPNFKNQGLLYVFWALPFECKATDSMWAIKCTQMGQKFHTFHKPIELDHKDVLERSIFLTNLAIVLGDKNVTINLGVTSHEIIVQMWCSFHFFESTSHNFGLKASKLKGPSRLVSLIVSKASNLKNESYLAQEIFCGSPFSTNHSFLI